MAETIPMRVDICGGWLDVPRFARDGAQIVNLAITPGLHDFQWRHGGGVGGSAAAAIDRGEDAIESELARGVGWQDPAVILETGLCIWESGPRPKLVAKSSGGCLAGVLALQWTGRPHDTTRIAESEPDLSAIERVARNNAMRMGSDFLSDIKLNISAAIGESYGVQFDAGMDPLPLLGEARKYCGSGFGGYALHMFDSREDREQAVSDHGLIAIEPFCRTL